MIRPSITASFYLLLGSCKTVSDTFLNNPLTLPSLQLDYCVDTRNIIREQDPERLLIGVSLGASGEASVCHLAYAIWSMLYAYPKRLARTKGAVYLQDQPIQPTLVVEVHLQDAA